MNRISTFLAAETHFILRPAKIEKPLLDRTERPAFPYREVSRPEPDWIYVDEILVDSDIISRSKEET